MDAREPSVRVPPGAEARAAAAELGGPPEGGSPALQGLALQVQAFAAVAEATSRASFPGLLLTAVATLAPYRRGQVVARGPGPCHVLGRRGVDPEEDGEGRGRAAARPTHRLVVTIPRSDGGVAELDLWRPGDATGFSESEQSLLRAWSPLIVTTFNLYWTGSGYLRTRLVGRADGAVRPSVQ